MTPRTLTVRELLTEAIERFGDDPRFFAYVCHACGDIACAQDFLDVGAIPSLLGQECIGRAVPVTGPDADRPTTTLRGCRSTAYGLTPGPWRVDLGDGEFVHSFRLATREEAEATGLSVRRYAARHTAEPYAALVRRQLAVYDLMAANDRIPSELLTEEGDTV
jgi:hypothetical protein